MFASGDHGILMCKHRAFWRSSSSGAGGSNEFCCRTVTTRRRQKDPAEDGKGACAPVFNSVILRGLVAIALLVVPDYL